MKAYKKDLHLCEKYVNINIDVCICEIILAQNQLYERIRTVMDIKLKSAAAFYTPDGVVADSPAKGNYATYREEFGSDTYRLYVDSDYKPAGVAIKVTLQPGVKDSVFMNGFQSATESREMNVAGKMSGMQSVSDFVKDKYAAFSGGDYAFVPYKNKPGFMHGFSYCYFKHGNNIKLFASLDESNGYTVFRFDAWSSTLRVSKDVEGMDKFTDAPAISLFYAEGKEEDVFDRWFKCLEESETVPAEKLIGYSTAGLDVISEDVIYKKIGDMKRFPVKANFFLVDERYCMGGDWLKYDTRKFPIGFKGVVNEMHDSGLIAGITMSPFTVDEKSKIAEAHSDWILRSEDGRYVKIKKNLYVLDMLNPEVREYVRECLHTILFMWGFDLVKLNNLYAAAMIPRKGKNRGQLMYDAISFLRECCGGKLIFADNVPLMSAFGKVDYCSVTCDTVTDNLPVYIRSKRFRESPSVNNATSDLVFRRQLSRRAFLNATCPFSLMEKEKFRDGNLNSAEQNLFCSVAGLFSSVLYTTDDVTVYDQKQKRKFRKMCMLSEASGVRVRKASGKHIVAYKLDDKNYFIKL